MVIENPAHKTPSPAPPLRARAGRHGWWPQNPLILSKTLKPFPPSRVFIDEGAHCAPDLMYSHSPQPPAPRSQPPANAARSVVAQIFNLPYRRVPLGWSPDHHPVQGPNARSPKIRASPRRFSPQKNFIFGIIWYHLVRFGRSVAPPNPPTRQNFIFCPPMSTDVHGCPRPSN